MEDTVSKVGRKLREVNPNFSPFFGYSEGENKLIITVNGQADQFSAVDEFIASSPDIEGWKFIALKQPITLSAETEIRTGSAILKVGEWRYTKSKNADGTYDFAIYVPNQVSDDPEGFNRLFTQLTTDFLGERFASTAIGNITVQQLGEDAPNDTLPFVGIYSDVNRSINKP